MAEARLRVLDRAAARTDLDPHERDIVARAQARENREFRQRRLTHSLVEAGRDVRRHAVAVVMSRGEGPRTRLGALLAVVAPRLARRRRRQRLGDTVEIGAGIRVARRA